MNMSSVTFFRDNEVFVVWQQGTPQWRTVLLPSDRDPDTYFYLGVKPGEGTVHYIGVGEWGLKNLRWCLEVIYGWQRMDAMIRKNDG